MTVALNLSPMLLGHCQIIIGPVSRQPYLGKLLRDGTEGVLGFFGKARECHDHALTQNPTSAQLSSDRFVFDL